MDHPKRQSTTQRLTFGDRGADPYRRAGFAAVSWARGDDRWRECGPAIGPAVSGSGLGSTFEAHSRGRCVAAQPPVAADTSDQTPAAARSTRDPGLPMPGSGPALGARNEMPAQPVWQAASIWSSASSGPISPAGKAALITWTKVSLHWPRRKSIGVPRNQVRPSPRRFSSLK